MKKHFRVCLSAFTLAVIFSASANMNLPLAQQAPTPLYDLVITNGRVVDGTGNPWFRADVAVKDGRIARIGHIYVPGTYAKTDEIVALARVVARCNGLYATHMRNEGTEVVDAIRESIGIGEQVGLPVEISHFKISARKLWGKSDVTLGLVRDARKRGLTVTVDQYAYTASSTSLDVRLPDWALAGGREEGKKRLSDA